MNYKLLAELVRRYDKDVLAAEIENCDVEVRTIDDLVEYLEEEAYYANY